MQKIDIQLTRQNLKKVHELVICENLFQHELEQCVANIETCVQALYINNDRQTWRIFCKYGLQSSLVFKNEFLTNVS